MQGTTQPGSHSRHQSGARHGATEPAQVTSITRQHSAAGRQCRAYRDLWRGEGGRSRKAHRRSGAATDCSAGMVPRSTPACDGMPACAVYSGWNSSLR